MSTQTDIVIFVEQIGEIITRWENLNRRRWSEQPQHLGLGESNAKDQSGIDLERASLLRFGHLPRLESLLQLLQRREHRRLGYTESISAETIPRSHGRRLLHRHFCGRIEIVDRRIGQYGPLVGSEGRKTIATARLHLSDILTRLLPYRRVAGGGNGELERRSVARYETGQISAPFTRVLCTFVTFRHLWQMVRLNWQR